MQNSTKPDLWRRKRFWVYLLLAIALVLGAMVFASLKWNWGWGWIGFNGGYPKITEKNIKIHGKTADVEYPPSKTLWDWLQLLVVPAMLAIGGFWLNQIQKGRDEKATRQRDKTEREIAADNQREAALQAYIDKMSELLLVNHLRESSLEKSGLSLDPMSKVLQPIHSQNLLQGEEAQQIARVRTLTAL